MPFDRARRDVPGPPWNTSLSESGLEILESGAIFTYVEKKVYEFATTHETHNSS